MPKLLFRHKKKEFEGFKNFVQQLEVTSYDEMLPRFQMAALEDPVYMSWVAKNLLDIDKFLALNPLEIEQVYNSLTEPFQLLVDAFHGTKEDSLFQKHLKPNDLQKYQYQITIHPAISEDRREKARASLLRAFRTLQEKGRVLGLPWRLPPLDVVRNPKNPQQPNGHFELYFDDPQILALKGEIKKARREGIWQHYYTTGKLMAEGEYKLGELDGHWIFYYPTGLKKGEGDFQKGKKAGDWKEWDRKGKECQVNYGIGSSSASTDDELDDED